MKGDYILLRGKRGKRSIIKKYKYSIVYEKIKKNYVEWVEDKFCFENWLDRVWILFYKSSQSRSPFPFQDVLHNGRKPFFRRLLDMPFEDLHNDWVYFFHVLGAFWVRNFILKRMSPIPKLMISQIFVHIFFIMQQTHVLFWILWSIFINNTEILWSWYITKKFCDL